MLITETDYFHGKKSRRFPIFSIDHKDGFTATGSINGELKIYHGSVSNTYKKHISTILCVRFDSYTSFLATGSDDHSVCVYERSGNEFGFVSRMEKHKLDVSGVAWTRHHLVSVGYDGAIIVYEKGSFDVVKTVNAFNTCRGLCNDPLNEYFLFQGDNKLKVFNNSFEEIQSLEGMFTLTIREAFFSRLSWSPDGKYVAVPLTDNNKANSVEILSRGTFDRAFSLIGHVAPCEVACFYPNMLMKNDKAYALLAVGSQDRSVSFWISEKEKPVLLVKNAFEQPILDMLWVGRTLYACSYDGYVKTFELSEEEIGRDVDNFNIGNASLVNIPFCDENVKIQENGIESVLGDLGLEPEIRKIEPKPSGIKRIKPTLVGKFAPSSDSKRIAPLVEQDKMVLDNHREAFVLFKATEDSPPDYDRVVIEEVASFEISSYLVKISSNKDIVVLRKDTVIYTLRYENILLFAGSKKFLAFVISKDGSDSLIVHRIETGDLHLPIISFTGILFIDICASTLLILRRDSQVQLINLAKVKNIIDIKLPRSGKLMNLRLDKKYTALALFDSGLYFIHLKLGVWIKKKHCFNSMFLSAGPSLNPYELHTKDETLNEIEYCFKVREIVGDVHGMAKAAKKAASLALKMDEFDIMHFNKFYSMFDKLIKNNQKRAVSKMLEEMNKNSVLHQFVVDMVKILKGRVSCI